MSKTSEAAKIIVNCHYFQVHVRRDITVMAKRLSHAQVEHTTISPVQSR